VSPIKHLPTTVYHLALTVYCEVCYSKPQEPWAFRARFSLLVLPRAPTDARGQRSALHQTSAGGEGEGMREWTKELAQAAGVQATGACMIGGRGGRRQRAARGGGMGMGHARANGGEGNALCCGTGDRHQHHF
jgi:hypothetical protein